MARNDIELKITADSRGVAAGLKPMMTSLDQAQAAAQETEAALDSIGTAPVHININDEAIAAARAEISRLRDQMREQLSTDINADTRDAEKRIKELQRSIKVLDAEKPVVDVEVRTTNIERLGTIVSEVRGNLQGGGGGGAGLISGLSLASRGIGGLAGSSAVAVPVIGTLTAALVAGGDAAWNLGQQAADAETSIAQLDALTKGMGAETFADLQKFAAETPFEMDEVTASTKRLVAAGVDLKDIPDTISDLGEVAAATGVPIEQISTVFAQMVSKGKASYEELQQLAEAGVPVWSILAEKLGLTVAQVQQLATDGKLSADAIKLLQESLAETYSGAMTRQAETFNGKMSTLHDNINQTGQAVGQVFLPAMKDIADVALAVTGPLLDATQAIGKWNTALEEKTGEGILGFVSPLAAGLDLINGGFDDTKDQIDDTSDAAFDFGHIITTVTDQITQAAEDLSKKAKELEDAFKGAVEEFEGIGGTIRAKVDFIISKDDLEDEIRKTIKGTEDEKPVELPASLRIGQIGGLTDKQQDLVSQLSSYVQQGLEEGAREADVAHSLGQEFDALTFYRDLRKDLKPLVLSTGIDRKNVDDFITDVLGVPADWEVQPTLIGVTEAQRAITEAFPTYELPIEVQPPFKAPGWEPAWNAILASVPTVAGTVGTGTPASGGAGAPPTVAAPRRTDNLAVSVFLDGHKLGDVPGHVTHRGRPSRRGRRP